MLKLVPYLVELGYFEEIVFHLLAGGQTKNAGHSYLNQLKHIHVVTNSYMVSELCEILRDCEDITIYETEQTDFLAWGSSWIGFTDIAKE
jgi:hypothetical protein